VAVGRLSALQKGRLLSMKFDDKHLNTNGSIFCCRIKHAICMAVLIIMDKMLLAQCLFFWLEHKQPLSINCDQILFDVLMSH